MPFLRARLLGLMAVLCLTIAAPAFAAKTPDALQFIPDETMFVMGLDVAKLRQSPAFEQFLNGYARDESGQSLIAQARDKIGLDLEKDIDAVYIAGAKDLRETQAMLILLQGRVTAKNVDRFVAESTTPLAPATHKGTKIFTDGKMAIGLLEDCIAIGQETTLRAAIDAGKSKRKALSGNPPLAKLVAGIDTGKSFWLALHVIDQYRKEISTASGPDFAALESVAATVDLTVGLVAHVVVDMGKKESAENVVKQINTQIAEFRKNPNPMIKTMFGGMFDKVAASAKGDVVAVAINLTDEDVKRLSNLASMAMSAQQNATVRPTLPPPQK